MPKRKRRRRDRFFLTCANCKEHPPLKFIKTIWGKEFFGCPKWSPKTKYSHTTVSKEQYINAYNLHLKEKFNELKVLEEIAQGFSSLSETFRRSCLERILDHMTPATLIVSVRGVCKEWYEMVMKKICRPEILSRWNEFNLEQRVFHLRLTCYPPSVVVGIEELLRNANVLTDNFIMRQIKYMKTVQIITNFSTCMMFPFDDEQFLHERFQIQHEFDIQHEDDKRFQHEDDNNPFDDDRYQHEDDGNPFNNYRIQRKDDFDTVSNPNSMLLKLKTVNVRQLIDIQHSSDMVFIWTKRAGLYIPNDDTCNYDYQVWNDLITKLRPQTNNSIFQINILYLSHYYYGMMRIRPLGLSDVYNYACSSGLNKQKSI